MSSDHAGVEIELSEVTKRYPGQERPAVDGLSLTIPAGEIVMFIGPSGCGKTTSLKMINRLIEPTSGTITINGQDITRSNPDELRRQIGYVIQGGSLFPHLTVAQNVALVPGLLKWDSGRTTKRVDELLDMVGLDPSVYRSRYPRELSGGQQQRVGVARGLAADPPVVLMDEPFGAVDPITRQRLQDELMSIQEELQKTIVCVTHDIDEAVKLGDRILLLSQGAHIAQYDKPEVLLGAPASDYVADFVGSGSTLKQLSLQRVSEIELSHPTTATVGSSVTEAKSRAAAAGDEAVIVLDDRNRPTDWVWARQLKGEVIRNRAEPRIATVDHRSTLADALDAMLATGHGGAIVTGVRDDYRGVVSFQAITDRIRAIDDEATERVAAEQTATEPASAEQAAAEESA